MSIDAETAGSIAYNVLKNKLHLPLIAGKANRDKIEDYIIIGIMSGQIDDIINQESVDIAIDLIDDMLVNAT